MSQDFKIDINQDSHSQKEDFIRIDIKEIIENNNNNKNIIIKFFEYIKPIYNYVNLYFLYHTRPTTSMKKKNN